MGGIPPLEHIEIHGLTSLRSLRLDLSTPVTVLIGPNGAGKSNIVGAFELLGRIVDGQLQDYVVRRGGFDRLLFAGPNASENPQRVSLEVWGTARDSLKNGYNAQLAPGRDDRAVIKETVYFHDTTKHPGPWDNTLEPGRESSLTEAAAGRYVDDSTAGTARYVQELLSGCRVFHFDDTSDEAPPKRVATIGDDLTLRQDAANIAPLLLRIREEHPEEFRRIVRAIRTVAPFFDDFVLRPITGDRIQLRWRQQANDRVFTASELSAGTLRFICLVVLLLQPDLPATVVLDEPELGLHPFAIHQLASLLHGATRDDRRVILATQSVTLLSQFSLEEVAVVERFDNATQVSRLDAEQLSGWLDDYSLGTLWEMNLLSGRPAPEALR